MQYHVEETSDRVIVVFIQSEYDRVAFGSLAPSVLESFCQQAVSTGKRLVFDLNGVHHLFSGDVGSLIQFGKTAKAQHVDFRLRNFSPEIRGMFELMKLHRVFLTDDDADDGSAP